MFATEEAAVEEAKKLVERSIQILDEVCVGWRERIDPHTFNIDDSGYCILGQLFVVYCCGLDELEALGHDLSKDDHGFNRPEPEAGAIFSVTYSHLQTEWLARLADNADEN